MKGVIAVCLKDLVCNKFGEDKWEQAVKAAGMEKSGIILPLSDVDDKDVLSLVKEVCNVLGITLEQAADAFGDYWVNVYSQKIYGLYYRGKTAKEFLLAMDKVHDQVTHDMKNAHPPHFTYEWENDNRLIMKYFSERGLIDFLVGLIRGVGKFYDEPMTVKKLNNQEVRVDFQ